MDGSVTVKASSTDKLLNLIRGGSEAKGGDSPPPRPLPPKKGLRERLSTLRGGQAPGGSGAKGVRVGVEIDGQAVRLVKLTRQGGRSGTLECRTVPVPAEGPEAPELSLVLRLALKDFVGKADADVWAMVPAEAADLRFIQVPKASRKLLSNAVYWTAKKEAPFDENEVVFDYEVQGEVMEKGAPRLSVMAYTVKREEFERLRNLFMQAGYPLAGVTVPSVAMRNLLRGGWVEDGARTQACLHLGGEFSRLEIFSGGVLQFVRVLKGGLSAMAQTLSDASRDYRPAAPASAPEPDPAEASHGESPASDPMIVPEPGAARTADTFFSPGFSSGGFSPGITVEIESMGPAPQEDAPQPLERPQGLTVDQARQLLENLASGPESLPEDNPGRAYSQADVLEMLGPSWERLLRQVQMTFSHHAVTLGNEQVGRLLISGPFDDDRGLLDYLSGKLGIPCALLDPLSPRNLGRLSVASPIMDLAQRQPYSLVLGLTDADRASCNLLYTYKQKEEEARIQGLNKLVGLCWLGAAGVVLGFFAWQMAQAHVKEQELEGLEAQLRQYQPQVDLPLLLTTGSKVRTAVDNLRRFGARNLPAAILRDLTELTPGNVKLFSISLDLGNPEEQPATVHEEQPKTPQRPGTGKRVREGMDTVTLEGYVTGDSQILESLLSAYLVRLRTSPLLGEPSVSKRATESAGGEDMLRFTLTCQVRR